MIVCGACQGQFHGYDNYERHPCPPPRPRQARWGDLNTYGAMLGDDGGILVSVNGAREVWHLPPSEARDFAQWILRAVDSRAGRLIVGTDPEEVGAP